jgi:hypothetical protein
MTLQISETVVKHLRFFVGSLTTAFHLVTDFSGKCVLVIYQRESPFLKVFLASEAIIPIIFQVSLLCSLVIFTVRVKILDSCKDLYLVIVVDSGVVSEDISCI